MKESTRVYLAYHLKVTTKARVVHLDKERKNIIIPTYIISSATSIDDDEDGKHGAITLNL